ncbi:MAG: exosome complex exonuclease Rrp41 [Candidatus Diapherotrites archaeon]|nr:exosome complex exonuclease Rrp41 [Candidatus Diapherotrites archaeon]
MATKKKEEKESKKESKSKENLEYVNKQGKRLDGRTVDETRPIKIKVGVVPNADGSAYLEWGQNKVIAAVYGPRECLPKHTANPYKAMVRYTYRMATFSVPDRKNPRPGRRDVEISKVSSEAFERAIFTEKFPNTAIDIYVEVLDSNAGTRIAALTTAAVAVADAGIPMRDMIAGVAVGKAGGNIIVDLNKYEEDAPDAVDIPIAILPNSEEIVLLQMDGLLSKKEWVEARTKAFAAIKKVHELQKQALLEKYKNFESTPSNDGSDKQ